MWSEIVACFDETLRNAPGMSEAIAAIQTLLEVIKRSNGKSLVVCTYVGRYVFPYFSFESII